LSCVTRQLSARARAYITLVRAAPRFFLSMLHVVAVTEAFTQIIYAIASIIGVSVFTDCVCSLYASWQRATMRLDDEKWLHENCRDPVFFTDLRGVLGSPPRGHGGGAAVLAALDGGLGALRLRVCDGDDVAVLRQSACVCGEAQGCAEGVRVQGRARLISVVIRGVFGSI